MKKICLFLLILIFLPINLYVTDRNKQNQIMKKAKIGSHISHIFFQFGKPDITFTEKSSHGAITSHLYDDGNTYVLVTSSDNRIIEIYSGIIKANK